MACLLAQEVGVPQVLALVHRAETTELWQRLGLQEVFSPAPWPRTGSRSTSTAATAPTSCPSRVAPPRSGAYLAPASPAAGVTLAEMKPPRGMIVGAVKRGEKVFVPRGNDRLEAGDLVILFVHEDELDTVRLLFPGRELTETPGESPLSSSASSAGCCCCSPAPSSSPLSARCSTASGTIVLAFLLSADHTPCVGGV